jgi:hypothetical protein
MIDEYFDDSQQNDAYSKIPFPIAAIVQDFIQENDVFDKFDKMLDVFKQTLKFYWVISTNDYFYNFLDNYIEHKNDEQLSETLINVYEIAACMNKPMLGVQFKNIKMVHKNFNKFGYKPVLESFQEIKNNQSQIREDIEQVFNYFIDLRNEAAHRSRINPSEEDYLYDLNRSKPFLHDLLKQFDALSEYEFIGVSEQDQKLIVYDFKGTANEFTDISVKIPEIVKERLEKRNVYLYHIEKKRLLSLSPFYFCIGCNKCAKPHLFQTTINFNKKKKIEAQFLDLYDDHAPSEGEFLNPILNDYATRFSHYPYYIDSYSRGHCFVAKSLNVTVRIKDLYGNAFVTNEMEVQRISPIERQTKKIEPLQLYPNGETYFKKFENELQDESTKMEVQSIRFDYQDLPEFPASDHIYKFRAMDKTKEEPMIVMPEHWSNSFRFFSLGFCTPLKFNEVRRICFEYFAPLYFFIDAQDFEMTPSTEPGKCYESDEYYEVELYIPVEKYDFNLIFPSGVNATKETFKLRYQDLEEAPVTSKGNKIVPSLSKYEDHEIKDHLNCVRYSVTKPILKENLWLSFDYYTEKPLEYIDSKSVLSSYLASYAVYKFLIESPFFSWQLEEAENRYRLKLGEPDGFHSKQLEVLLCEADEEDLSELTYICHEARQFVSIKKIMENLQQCFKKVNEKIRKVYKVVKDGRIIGVISVRLLNGEVLIDNYVIKPNLRAIGIGSVIYPEFGEKILQIETIQKIRIHLHHRLLGSLSFFYDKGFRMHNVQTNLSDPKDDSVELLKIVR